MKHYMTEQQKMMKKCKDMMAVAPTKCAKDMLMGQYRDMSMHYRNNKTMYEMYCTKKGKL